MTIRGWIVWAGLALTLAGPAAAQGTGQGAAQTVSTCADRTRYSPHDAAIPKLVFDVDRLVGRFEMDQALALVKQGLVDHPNDSLLEDALGRALYRNGQLSEAIDAFNRAIREDPCDGRPHYDAWRVELMAGLWQQAQRQLDLAHMLDSKVGLVQRVWRFTQVTKLPDAVVADAPPHFNFYARHVDCDGIEVRAAAVVDPVALVVACGHIRQMLEHLPNVRANLVARGAELHIMGEDQRISDLPEARNERGERLFVRMGDTSKNAEKVDVDAWAGATGGIYANCPEKNLMHLPGDGFGARDEVCVHEFAHDIMNTGFDTKMQGQIEAAYKASMKKGLWKGAYAATDANEWWADLSSWYFGAQGGVHGMQPPVPDPGPAALKAYDPEGYALLDRMYRGVKQPRVVHESVLRPIREVNVHLAPQYEDADVLFVNNSPVRHFLFWVDNNGVTHASGFLDGYSRRLIHDYTGRDWMVVDPRTKAEVLYLVTQDQSEIVVEDRGGG